MEKKDTKGEKELVMENASVVTFEGMEYMVPPHPEYPQHRIGTLAIELDKSGCVDTESHISSLILCEKDIQQHFCFIVFDIDEKYYPLGNEPIEVAVYEEGKRNPLYCHSVPGKKGDYHFTGEGMAVTPGDYLIYVGNAMPSDKSLGRFVKFGNGYAYRLRIMQHGSRMEHPDIRHAHVDGDLNLCMTLESPLDITSEELSCECYDENYRMVAASCSMKVSDNTVELPMNPFGWWLDGTYHVLVYHNQQLYAHYSFSYENYEISGTRQEPLVPLSQYYELHRIMKKTPHGSTFGKLQGCRGIKKHLLRLRAKNIFVPINTYTFTSEHELEKMMVSTLFGIVYPRLTCTPLDCKEVAEAVRNNEPLEMLKSLFRKPGVVVVHHLDYLMMVECAWMVEYLYQQASLGETVVVLYGTEAELDAIMVREPRFEEIIPDDNRWETEPYTLSEQLRIAENFFFVRRMDVAHSARILLKETFARHADYMRGWTAAHIEDWLKKNVLARQVKRVLGYETCMPEILKKVEDGDICLVMQPQQPMDTFDGILSELDGMVGLGNIKKHLKKLFWQMSFQKKRAKLGLGMMKQVLPHMVFTGNPGTGKTTVARLIGQVFKKLGMLSNGEVITMDRTQLVGQYIGETEHRMKDVLKKAKGNVLFIDEAYSLSDNSKGDRKDYGYRVLESLLPVLADPDNDILVILAGYEKEMEQMLAMNPGMKGRFPYSFRFEDYDAGELKEIAVRLLEKMDFVIDEEASDVLLACMDAAVSGKDEYFHNARWATQLVQEGILGAMAERLCGVDATLENRELFCKVTAEDVKCGFAIMCPETKRVRAKVGFR